MSHWNTKELRELEIERSERLHKEREAHRTFVADCLRHVQLQPAPRMSPKSQLKRNRKKGEGAWVNWHISRRRMSCNPTAAELRRTSWRRPL